ncbi:MAG: efflux RND transporter permease subunit, partial [Isosphaeraceae bacterium]
SAFNSLTLSPALAALLLRPRDEETARNVLPRAAYGLIGAWIGWTWVASRVSDRFLIGGTGAWGHEATVAAVGALVGLLLAGPLDALLARFFRLFDRVFKFSTGIYGRVVRGLMRVSVLVLVVYVGLLGLTYYSFISTPTGFIPSQDMGYLLCSVQLPDSASNERTRAVMSRLEQIARATPGVKHTQAMSGQSLLLSSNSSNFGSMFVILDEFSKRPNPVLSRFFSWFDESVTRIDQRVEGLYRFLSDPEPAPRRTPRAVRKDEGGKAFEAGERQGPSLSDRIRPWIPFRATMRSWLGSTEEPKGSATGPRMDRLRRAINPPQIEARVRRWLRSPKEPVLHGDAIADELRKRFGREVNDAIVTVLGPPPVRGVGRAGGFKILIEDRGDNGPIALQEQTDNIAELCKTQPGPGGTMPGLVGITTVFRANVPQVYVDVDRKACMSKGVPLRDLFDTMRVYLGSLYVNDFNRFGRTWQVVVQADSRFRNSIDDVRRLRVRNQQGAMVPLGTLAEVREENGPLVLTRYNMYPAAPINGAAAPGVSSGDAIKIVERVCNDPNFGLPQSFSFEWTELAYLELQAGDTAVRTFVFAVVAVFLVLAAQYESWGLPLAIILVVPMCLLSAIAGVMATFQDINIFTQIGFVVLVGLASKNAILIVEFAKARREEGESRLQAAVDACTLRLRPIVMTSFAFILGVLPLLLSEGAGAEMRRTLGTTVFSGMLGVTIFGIFLTPVFFVTIDWLGSRPALLHGPLRTVSDAVLWVLSFGWLGLAVRVVTPRIRSRLGMSSEFRGGDVKGIDSRGDLLWPDGDESGVDHASRETGTGLTAKSVQGDRNGHEPVDVGPIAGKSGGEERL